MQFFQSVAICASALAAFAAAQSTSVAIYNMPDTVMVGKTTQLQVHSGNGPFTLTLRRGNPMDLQNVSTITTTGTGSSFSWTPSSDLENGSDYAIMISQGEQSNYTPEFTITGGKASGSGSGSGSSSPGSYGGASSSSAGTTMSTAAKTASASGCAITQIRDGQPQAPASCTSSATAAAASSTATYAAGNSTAPTNAPVGSPYSPQAGSTGSPAAGNSTVPTYSVPSPTSGGSSSGSSSSSGSQSSAPAPKQGGAAQFGSSFALIAGAVAAFAFLN